MIIQETKNVQEIKYSEKMRILIVDDDLDVLASMKDVVELDIPECIVEVASNVEQAKLVAKQVKPNIALLDIKLGQDSGLDLIPELKAICPDISIIMMTAYRDNKYTVKAVRFGANDYLYKPVKPDELIKTITRLMQYQNFKREKDEADKRFYTVFEQATQWLFLLDSNGFLIDANQIAMSFISETKKNVLGTLFLDSPWYVSSVKAQEIIQAGLSEANNGILFQSEFDVFDSEQNNQTFDFYMKPVFDDENKVNQIVVECRNITERKKAALEIKALNEALELRVKERTLELEQSMLLLKQENKERKRAEEEAYKASEAKSNFLSRMSHELRTPMNAILGFGQLLELDSSEFTEDQNLSIKEIMKSGDHLLRLINEVLDLVEIESGKIDVEMGGVNLDDVITDVTSLMKPLMEARQIKQIDNVSGKGYVLHADATRLKQVLINLLSNAIKYNQDNGTITLGAEITDKQYLRINVTDTGEGISEDDIGKLFKSFERLNMQYNVEGTGIGLVITKSLVELMNGRVGVESKLGEGSTFYIELGFENDNEMNLD